MPHKNERLVSLLCGTLLILSIQTVSAATAPPLGTAASFAVLGGSGVTNTGPTVIHGNLGVSPGSAVTSFPPGIVVPPGTIHAADAVAAGAQSDSTIAYNALAGQACNLNLTGQDLGGLTLIPGVYCLSSSAQLTGALTLDAQGNANAVFVFQIGSALTTASNSSVNIINGGTVCNVFWQIGSSATFGTSTSFAGNVLALTSITVNNGSTLAGRALAHDGAVTLDTNNISAAQCNPIFVAPPTITVSFGAASLGVGDFTTKTFTVSNPNDTPLTGIAFTDTLPAGLVVATPNGLTGSCGAGTITAIAGSGSISLAGGSVAGSGSCTFSVNVTATTTGVKTNSATVGSSEGGTGNTSVASVTVLPAPPPSPTPPVITKVFGAASIGVGGTTTLSFTISNPNGVPLTGVAFTDSLPAGLVVSTPNGLAGSCGGGTITAVAGSGSVSLTSATIAGGSSCTFSVSVTGTATGAQSNSVAVTSTNGGAGNTSTVVVTVVPAVIAPPAISKSFGAASSTVVNSFPLTFTINNPNPAVPLTAVGFIDVLPAGMVVTTPNGLTGSCGGGTIVATPGTGVISLTGGTLPGGASCMFSVDVTATIAGTFANLTGNVTSSNGGTGNTAEAELTLLGDFEVSYFANLQSGDSVINITNTGANGASLNGPGFGQDVGSICVNVYAFSPDEQMVSCCSCRVTPNGLAALSVVDDLINTTLTGIRPNSIVVKLLATRGTSCGNSAAAAGSPGFPVVIAGSKAAWGTTIHPGPGGTFVLTETPFIPSTLSPGELASLTNRCTNIIGNGSGFGICRACRQSGLGAGRESSGVSNK